MSKYLEEMGNLMVVQGKKFYAEIKTRKKSKLAVCQGCWKPISEDGAEQKRGNDSSGQIEKTL